MGRILLAAMVLMPGMMRAEDPLPGSESEPKHPPRWLWAVPGGGQFALGQTSAGWAWLSGTLALGGWGAWAESRRGSGELNAPFVYAQQVWVMSLYAARRDLMLRVGETARLDPSQVSTLARAPFTPSMLINPWVLGFAAVGVGVNWLGVRQGGASPGASRIRTVSYLGDTFGRRAGAAAMAGYWIPLSWGAGESEEMLFRGMIQADWEEKWGRVGGWLAASALFGIAHFPIGAPAGEAAAQIGFAAAAGAWLGWRYQRTGYRLAEPIAAHVWFDIAAGVTIWLLDPAENPLGAKVSFAL